MVWKLVGCAVGDAALVMGLAFCGSASADPVAPSAVGRVAAALDNVRALSFDGKDGYATIWDGNKYVQCRGDPGRPVRCEAAGSLMQPSLARVLTPDRLKVLTAAGWRLDTSFGNYVRTFAASAPSPVIATAVVDALTSAYEADPDQLELQTAWVATDPCPPRHGPSQNLAGMVDDSPSMAETAVRCVYDSGEARPSSAPVVSADALVARDGAVVTAELQRLQLNATRKVFAIFNGGVGYVQCQPMESPAGLYCEAASADSWAALSGILTPARIAELHADGYADPGRAPNYAKIYPADRYDSATVARELLTILFDVYGDDDAQPLTVNTEMNPPTD